MGRTWSGVLLRSAQCHCMRTCVRKTGARRPPLAFSSVYISARGAGADYASLASMAVTDAPGNGHILLFGGGLRTGSHISLVSRP